MIYKRQYVQYNDLVFDEAEMISADDYSVSFKDYSADYSFGHGSYAPLKSKTGLVRASSVSLTITLRMNKLPCDQREYYPEFAKDQLLEAGKLWALHGNHLEWAFAYVTSYSESQDSRNDTVEIDVDFALPEGIWHKADKLRTFLLPYSKCDIFDCRDYHSVNPCRDGCCMCHKVNTDQCNCCCDDVTEDMALCYHMDELDAFLGCDPPFRIKYDCVAADNFFGDFLGNTHIGQQICSECGGTIAGMFYSETNLPTDNVRIILHGHVKDPYIEINDNGNIIHGEYEGTLVINPDGSVYHTPKNGCKDCDNLVEASAWEIPEGMSYGWEIHHGNNSVVVESNVCCGTVCVYIDADAITL